MEGWGFRKLWTLTRCQSPVLCPLSIDTYYLHKHLKWRLLEAYSFPQLTTLYWWHPDYLPETQYYSKGSSNWLWFILFWTPNYWGMMLISMKNPNNPFKRFNNSAKQNYQILYPPSLSNFSRQEGIDQLQLATHLCNGILFVFVLFILIAFILQWDEEKTIKDLRKYNHLIIC